MLKWESHLPPLPDRVVDAAELILDVRLPESYRKLAQRWPCGRPSPNEFDVTRPGGSWRSCIGVLLSLDPRHSENVFRYVAHEPLDDPLPLPFGLVPIIDDGGGDLVCLDYREHELDPPVIYWAHELGGVDGIVPISPTFDAFLATIENESRLANGSPEVPGKEDA